VNNSATPVQATSARRPTLAPVGRLGRTPAAARTARHLTRRRLGHRPRSADRGPHGATRPGAGSDAGCCPDVRPGRAAAQRPRRLPKCGQTGRPMGQASRQQLGPAARAADGRPKRGAQRWRTPSAYHRPVARTSAPSPCSPGLATMRSPDRVPRGQRSTAVRAPAGALSPPVSGLAHAAPAGQRPPARSDGLERHHAGPQHPDVRPADHGRRPAVRPRRSEARGRPVGARMRPGQAGRRSAQAGRVLPTRRSLCRRQSVPEAGKEQPAVGPPQPSAPVSDPHRPAGSAASHIARTTPHRQDTSGGWLAARPVGGREQQTRQGTRRAAGSPRLVGTREEQARQRDKRAAGMGVAADGRDQRDVPAGWTSPPFGATVRRRTDRRQVDSAGHGTGAAAEGRIGAPPLAWAGRRWKPQPGPWASQTARCVPWDDQDRLVVLST
jgi:hypothetical protein